MAVVISPIPDIKPSAYCRVFQSLARKAAINSARAQETAQSAWPRLGKENVDPAAMGCDTDLITLGLAKDEGGVVYMKFDLSGWDE
jgi:hypothetical protein